MNDVEFCKKWVGVRWVDRGISESGIDCWGLVYRWMKDVEFIKVSKPSHHTDIIEGFFNELSTGKWMEVDKPIRGLVFMSFNGEAPTHCGIVLDRLRVIHSAGSNKTHGSVSVNTIRAITKMFGKMRFFKRVENGNN